MNDLEQWMDLAEEAGQLREALASRAPIEQAKGIILVLRSTDTKGAYELLKAASMHRNIKLAALAAAIVDVSITPSPVFTQALQPNKEHIVAFELLEEWGMDFGHMPNTGMEQR